MASRPFRAPRLAWQLELLLGAVCVALGIALTAKPFDSLSVLLLFIGVSFIVTGVSELASSRTSPEPRLTAAAGLAWVIVGVVALAWPGMTIGMLVILAGASMLVGGLIKVASGLRGTSDDRLIFALNGLAGIVFGLLALSWPDVTVLIIALLVGPRIILFGLGQIATALSHRPSRVEEVEQAPPRTRSRWPRWLRIGGAGASLVLALGLLTISAWIHDASPTVDAFYAAPDDVAAEPGQLIRSEPFSNGVPADGIGWRILYTTTDVHGASGVASAIVITPALPPAEPQPIVAWTHGTTGIQPQCAPSMLGLESGAFFMSERVIQHGWTLVATDYAGLGTEGPHPYLIGEGQGGSALDAVRAARQMPELNVDDRTVVWGHSQGGHAALWTGILAPTYAPDAGVVGVAALAPAADLIGLFEALDEGPIAVTLFAYIISAYSDMYEDVSFGDYVRPAARIFVRETADRCLSEPATLLSIIGALPFDGSIFQLNPLSGPLGDRLLENIPDRPIEVPLVIAQGASDRLILPSVQRQFVDRLCAGGQRMGYWTYEGLDHVPLVELDSPLIDDLFAWTEDILDGTVERAECTILER